MRDETKAHPNDTGTQLRRHRCVSEPRRAVSGQRILRVLSGQIGTRVRPHGLRHTAITAALDVAAAHGLSIDLVRQFSRHKSIGTLLVYRDEHENKQGVIAGWVADHISPVRDTIPTTTALRTLPVDPSRS